MADGDEPPGRAPAPAGTYGPGTPTCRAVPRIHAFGKGGQALRRDPRAPPTLRGWLHKQDSSGLRLWKRRWFVLVDLCLYYYRDSSEQQVRGGLPLPGYEIRVLPPGPRGPRTPRFLFTAEHPGMRTYCLGTETPEELNVWVCALRQGAAPLARSPGTLFPEPPQELQSVGPPPPLFLIHPPGEELSPPSMPHAHQSTVSLLPLSKVEAPDRRGSLGPPVVAAAAAAVSGRGHLELRLPGAENPLQLPAMDAAKQETATSQTPASPTGSSDWLPLYEGSDETPPSRGSPPIPSPSPREGASGRGLKREGAADHGRRRPIRITLLQASF